MKQMAIIFLVLIFAVISYSQSSTPGVTSAAKDDSAPKQPMTEEKVARWFEIEQFTAAVRYHFVENDNRAKASNNAQYAFGAKFRFNSIKKQSTRSFLRSLPGLHLPRFGTPQAGAPAFSNGVLTYANFTSTRNRIRRSRFSSGACMLTTPT